MTLGHEVDASGTPLLQGHVCFAKRKRLQQVTSLIGQVHHTVPNWHSVSSGTVIEFCKKDGDFAEVGTLPIQTKNQNERKHVEIEVEEFCQSVKEGMTDSVVLRELHPSVWVSSERFCIQCIEDHLPKHTVALHPLRQWQSNLNGRLLLPPNDRETIFVVDPKGNQGKSWFVRHSCDLHDDAQITVPGRKADMASVVHEDTKVFFFDHPRSKQGEFAQCNFLEELMNGCVFSPKCESRVNCLAVPHVVVMMNEHPDFTKMTEDKHSVTVLS